MTQIRGKLLASIAGFAPGRASVDRLLTGSIISASGHRLEGMQVSAKKESSTSVYTDQSGELLPADGRRQIPSMGAGPGLPHREGGSVTINNLAVGAMALASLLAAVNNAYALAAFALLVGVLFWIKRGEMRHKDGGDSEVT